MVYIYIRYDEGNKTNLNYSSVELHYDKNHKKIFNTGNFVKDWYDMRKFMVMEIENESIFNHSSIVFGY